MNNAGILLAEREGPHIKLTMAFPDGFDHAFMVERFTVNPAGEETWQPIHTGTAKFVNGDTDWDMAALVYDSESDTYTPEPLHGPRTYRALAYRDADPDANVTVLHTNGIYTDPVSV